MDDRLVEKTYRSVIFLWALTILWCLVLREFWVGLSITIGAALSSAVLFSYEYAVRKAFVPGAKKPGKYLFKLALLKMPAIGIILYMIVRWNRINLPAFCGGIFLVHLALFAKLAGIRLVEQLKGQDVPSSGKER